MERKPTYSLEDQGPFSRAHVRVFGRTKIESEEAARAAKDRLTQDLSKECTLWPPKYSGFEEDVGRHCAVVVVTLGGDRQKAREQLDTTLGQLPSSK